MRKEVAQVWAAALRDSSSKQGRNALEHRGKVCVLGVLCLLALTVGVCDYEEIDGFSYFDGENRKVPLSVKKWAKIKEDQPVTFPDYFVSITWLNDNGYTFNELADLIEKHYDSL